MWPMSLYESGESTGEISLKALFEQPEQILVVSAMVSVNSFSENHRFHSVFFAELACKPMEFFLQVSGQIL